jgi:hypothetical protein
MVRSVKLAAVGVLLVLGTAPLVARQSASVPGRDGDADRVVAERILRLGGSVVLDGQRRPIRDIEQLPDSAFTIHTLDLVGVSMGA